MINDPGGVRRNRRKSPTHTHAPAQRRRSVINRFRPSGKVHTVLSIKSGPRLFPSPLCFGLFTRRRSRFVAHPPLMHAAAVCRANYNEPPSVASLPSTPPLIPHTSIYLYFLFASFSLPRQLSLSVIVHFESRRRPAVRPAVPCVHII